MKIKAKEKKGIVKIKLLIKHPMETGRRKDADGNLIPAHFLNELKVTYEDKVVLLVELGATVSKDPYMAFSFAGAKGGTVYFETLDSTGAVEKAEALIK
jgi:sulfur-oxidizing protein SoxZ